MNFLSGNSVLAIMLKKKLKLNLALMLSFDTEKLAI